MKNQTSELASSKRLPQFLATAYKMAILFNVPLGRLGVFLLFFTLSNPAFSQVIASGGSSYSSSSFFLCSTPGVPLACGNNSSGKLGDGTSTNKYLPVPVSSLSDITAIVTGGFHSLFLKNNGTVWACGSNYYGQLGNDTVNSSYIPVKTKGLAGITAIASGSVHSLFLKNDSTVWACGANINGQLGYGTGPKKYKPVQVSGLTGITAITAGYSHSLFLKSDGTVWACGYNNYGQLGDGTIVDRYTPVQVNGLTGIIAIAGGYGHSLFLKNDGTVWACGTNYYGQLGDGTNIGKRTPVQVSGLTGIIKIAVGTNHSLFLKSNGTVWLCGDNQYGQIGDGSSGNKSIPRKQKSLTGITAIAGGFGHSLFLKNDGTVWACGRNLDGQLGNGTTTTSYTPVNVLLNCSPTTIKFFKPAKGCSNISEIKIVGTNFTGATAVSFGGIPAASFTVNSDKQITATPAVGGSGAISVTTPLGIGHSTSIFTIISTVPTHLTTTNITATEATVNWDVVNCTIGYILHYRVAGGNWISLASKNYTPSKVLTGLQPSTNYDWRVKSKLADSTNSANSPIMHFTTLPLREGELANSGALNIFPNPTSGSVTVTLKDCENCDYQMHVYDVLGHLVYTDKSQVDGNSKTVDLSSLAKGIYQVRVLYNEQVSNCKLVIQ